MILQVRQILDRATQGITRPFLCVAGDGETYFVKGAGAGLDSLVAEWVAGSLAQRLALPVPEFRMVEVTQEVLRYTALESKGDLGAGVWFGSRRVDFGENLSWPNVTSVRPSLRAKVLLFDWWVANGDRSLTPTGGNVNLLLTPTDMRLHLIDHNQAFDDHDLALYMRTHVFRSAAAEWTDDFRLEQTARLSAVASHLDLIWQEMPEEWTAAGCSLTFRKVQKLLWRLVDDPASFWSLP